MNENTNAIGVAAITELRKVIQDLHGLIEETNAIVQAIVASDMGFVWDTGLDD